MAADLKVGAPAMLVIYVKGQFQIRHGEITRIGPDSVGITIAAGEASRRFAREGYSWIRGYHKPDSSELRALLVAATLEGDNLK